MELSTAEAALYERRRPAKEGERRDTAVIRLRQARARQVDRRYRVAWLIALFIAVLYGTMAIVAVDTKSPTFDEPQHLTAGYSYWIKNDFRLDPENGNLPARFAALPLL